MLASDLGLLLSGLALCPLIGMPPARLGWINLFGLGGMAAVTSIGAAFSADGAQIGTLAGSIVGLGAGIIVTGYMRFDSSKKRKKTQSQGRSPQSARLAKHRDSASGLPSLIADWIPYVMLQPDLDPATGQPLNNRMRLVAGVTGLLR